MRSTEPRIAATGVGERSLIARGLLVNYASLGVSLLSMLILTPVLLRSLGPGAYGFWAILGSLSSYFVLLDFGMNTAVAKYTAEYRATDQRARLSATVSTILALVVAVGVVASGVSLALAASVPRIFGLVGELARGGAVAFVVTVLTVGTLLIGGVLGNVIYGWQRVDLFKAFGIAQVAANFVLTVALLRAGTGIIGVAVAGLASSAILIVLHMVFLRRSGYGVVVSPRLVRLETLKDVAAFSVRTFVLGVSARALYYSDYLVIGILLGAAEVAPYEVAYKLCFLSTYVFSVISTTMFPRFATLHAVGDMASLAGLYLRLAKASLLLMMPVGLFLAFYGEPIIALWVGPAAFAGTGVLLVLVVMNVFHAIGTPAAMALQSSGRNRELMYAEILNAVVNVVLSVVLVSRLGIVGAAIGTLAAHVLTTLWVVLLLPCRQMGLSVPTYLKQSVAPPIVVGLLTAGALWLLTPMLGPARGVTDLAERAVILIVTFGVLYLGLGSSRDERRMYGRWLRALPSLH